MHSNPTPRKQKRERAVPKRAEFENTFIGGLKLGCTHPAGTITPATGYGCYCRVCGETLG